MFKDLEELQINDCQTDICLVGAGGVKVFNHCTMLFADHVHVQPDSVWCQLDSRVEDGKFVVIVPDASYADISDSSSFL